MQHDRISEACRTPHRLKPVPLQGAASPAFVIRPQSSTCPLLYHSISGYATNPSVSTYDDPPRWSKKGRRWRRPLKISTRGGIRTCGLLLRRQALYPLSYAGLRSEEEYRARATSVNLSTVRKSVVSGQWSVVRGP